MDRFWYCTGLDSTGYGSTMSKLPCYRETLRWGVGPVTSAFLNPEAFNSVYLEKEHFLRTRLGIKYLLRRALFYDYAIFCGGEHVLCTPMTSLRGSDNLAASGPRSSLLRVLGTTTPSHGVNMCQWASLPSHHCFHSRYRQCRDNLAYGPNRHAPRMYAATATYLSKIRIASPLFLHRLSVTPPRLRRQVISFVPFPSCPIPLLHLCSTVNFPVSFPN